jgi:hypothetical protein
MHLLLDRMLTAALTLRIVGLAPSFSKTEAAMADLSMEKRINLAKVLGAISDSCADDIKAVNKVRNKFAHYHPNHGRQLNNLPELSSEDAFERCAKRATRALEGVIRVGIKPVQDGVAKGFGLAEKTL